MSAGPTVARGARPDTGRGDVRPASQQSGLRRRTVLAIVMLPDVAPLAAAAVAVVALVAVLLDAFRPVVLVPLVVVAIAAAFVGAARWGQRRDGATVVGALLMVVAVLAWVWWSRPYASQYVVVDRDPGFFTLQAMWLTEHGTAAIPLGEATTVADAVRAASAETAAFARIDGALYAQGPKMLPAVLGLVAWTTGSTVLVGNLVIGAAGLLAVYAAARRLVGPLWALVPAVGLGLTLPFLVFTRAPYTEPLTLVLVWGSLAAVLAGMRTRGWAPWWSAAVLVAALCASRVDGALTAVGLLVAFTGTLLLTLPRHDRAAHVRRVALVAGAAVLGWALGLADVWTLSPGYAANTWGDIGAVGLLLGAATLMAGAAALAPVGLRSALVRRSGALGIAVAIAVVALTLALSSRPLWYVGRALAPSHPAVGYIATLQQQQGLPVDGTRSYDELSVSWMTWYLGLPTAVLAGAALALMVWWAIRYRRPEPWIVAVVVLVATAYYFAQVRITPDQVWAVRRLLPVAVPGLLLAATWLVALVGGGGRVRRAIGVVLAAAVALTPLHAWDGLEDHVEHRGRYAQFQAACSALDAAGAERVVWLHSRDLATVRVVCDVEVVEVLGTVTAADLRAIRAAWGGDTVAVMAFTPDGIPWAGPPGDAVVSVETTTLERPLTRRPSSAESRTSSIWLGLVRPDGTVAPAASP